MHGAPPSATNVYLWTGLFLHQEMLKIGKKNKAWLGREQDIRGVCLVTPEFWSGLDAMPRFGGAEVLLIRLLISYFSLVLRFLPKHTLVL